MARAKATDLLSSEAQKVLAACLREHLPAAAIVARIKAETGEDVAERTIGRRKAEWDAEAERRRRGREQMEDLLAAAREGNHTASEMVNALAMEQLMRDPEGSLTLDPIELQRTSIAAERVRLDAKRLALKEREVALNESKFQLLQAQQQRAIEETKALEQRAASGAQLTAEDIRRIRDVYGV